MIEHAAPPPGAQIDPLERLADVLGRCERRWTIVDHRPDRGDLGDLEEDFLCELRETIIDRATFERAASALGALMQLTAAKVKLDNLFDGFERPDHERRRMRQAVDRVIYSIAAFLEDQCPAPRTAFGIDRYLPERCDLTAGFMAALATA